MLSSFKPRGAYLFQTRLKGGCLIEMRGLFDSGGGGGGGYFNLAKMVVSVLYKELEFKAENLKYKKLEVMQPRIKSKFDLP